MPARFDKVPLRSKESLIVFADKVLVTCVLSGAAVGGSPLLNPCSPYMRRGDRSIAPATVI